METVQFALGFKVDGTDRAHCEFGVCWIRVTAGRNGGRILQVNLKQEDILPQLYQAVEAGIHFI